MPSSSSLFSPPITHRRSWSSRLHSRTSSPHYVCITLSSSFQTPHSRSTTAPASYIEGDVSSRNRMAISTTHPTHNNSSSPAPYFASPSISPTYSYLLSDFSYQHILFYDRSDIQNIHLLPHLLDEAIYACNLLMIICFCFFALNSSLYAMKLKWIVHSTAFIFLLGNLFKYQWLFSSLKKPQCSIFFLPPLFHRNCPQFLFAVRDVHHPLCDFYSANRNAPHRRIHGQNRPV